MTGRFAAGRVEPTGPRKGPDGLDEGCLPGLIAIALIAVQMIAHSRTLSLPIPCALKACAHFLQCVAGQAGPTADPESKGSIPYGAVIAWAWSEGLVYTANRGWPEPVFEDITISKIVDDAMDGITGVVRKLPAFQLHPDLQEPSTVTKAGADAFAHMARNKSTLELNWELIQAGSNQFIKPSGPSSQFIKPSGPSGYASVCSVLRVASKGELREARLEALAGVQWVRAVLLV